MNVALSAANSFATVDYSADVVRLFKQACHAGSLAGIEHAVCGQAGMRAKGASVRLWLQFRDDRVQTARFEAYGCPHFLAAAEALCDWAEHRTRTELETWNWSEVAAYLAMPPAKRARLLVLEDALRHAAGVVGQNR